MNFDEWFLSNGIPLDTDFNVAKRAFEAGKQSQQAKIDEFQKLRSLDEMEINQLAQANQVWRTKCDELQERIEEVLIEMKNQLGAEDYYGMERPDYDAMLYALRNIKDTLKGNKDEN